MKFHELDQRMRIFETAHDLCVLPDLYMVARLDGRSFTRLTREVHAFEAPFDQTLRDFMVQTCKHLMQCGFNVIYAYTQSDEISLLFDKYEQSFGRKVRKFNSILAGEASSCFSLALGTPACFDSRISQLPTPEHVLDYFQWRQSDAHRNSLNAHCYWTLRKQDIDAKTATRTLSGRSTAWKNEFLFQNGCQFNELPLWQKRGVGLYWEDFEKSGTHPLTQEPVTTARRRIQEDLELPMKDDYRGFLKRNILHLVP